MADKNVFDRLADWIDGLPNILAKAYAAKVIKTVDENVSKFIDNMKVGIPTARPDLSSLLDPNVLQVTRSFTNGKYGYRISFVGYKDEKEKVAWQMLANVWNTGRVAGTGTAETDREYGYGDLAGIKFITNNIPILRQINETLYNNIVIGGWSVDDEKVTLNDGSTFTKQELAYFDNILKQIGE